MLPATAFGPLHCEAIQHLLIYNIGWSILDACVSAPHCMNPDRQYHLVIAPVKNDEHTEIEFQTET